MTRLFALTLSFMLAFCAVVPTPAMAEAMGEALSSAEVVALGAAGDGRTVKVRGEALGETILDGTGGGWVNVLSDGVALGLWGDPQLFEPIGQYGGYHWRGAIVEATGVYNAACDRHGGDRDVHIEALNVVEPGRPLDRPAQPWKLIAGLAMAGTAGVLWMRHRERMQRAY